MPDITPISPFLTGNTTFASSDVPQLIAGDYSLTASLNAAGSGITTNNSFSQSLSFAVAGPRFRLQHSDILMLSPADESLGDNHNTVPSIYFTRSTLPWERSPVVKATGKCWLAIVLVTEDEASKYSVSNMPLSSFLHQSEWESTDDPQEIVTVLSLEPNFGKSVLPLYTDLELMAHVRYMDLENGGAAVRRAIVLGTRFPAAGKRNTCFLVSIENCYSASTQSLIMPAGGANIQLAVLKSWSFTNTSPDYDFEGLMTAPNMAPAPLRLPPVAAVTGSVNPEAWLAKGYVLLPSYYRSGESSAAWYHGPLLPGEDRTELPLPTLSPDSLQVFDSETGMMDAGYAAAWELGRLISLANSSYLKALYATKQAINIRRVQKGQVRVTEHLPINNPQSAWNWIGANQTAFFRLNAQESGGAWLNLVDGNAYGDSLGKPYLRLNEHFGCSPALSAKDAILLPLSQINAPLGFAVSFWVWLDSSNQDTQTLLKVYDSKLAGNYLKLYYSGEELYLNDGHNTTGGNLIPLARGWNHIGLAIEQDSSYSYYATLYLNGTYYANQSLTGNTITYNSAIIGSDLNQKNPAPGTYANVRMSKAPMGAAEFQAMYGSDLSLVPIYQHLNNLKCLKGLPFSYLVPDANMMPPESLRFFELGKPWMAALMDGATSLGRISETQMAADAELQKLLGLELPGKATGVLLRSAVVNAFPTLEIDGYSVAAKGADPMPANALLPVLRREILSQDLIFILFLGELVTLDIHPHSETLHYGVYDANSSTIQMYYRNTQGQEMPVGQPPHLSGQPYRETKYRTMNLSAMASSLSHLIGIGSMTSGMLGIELLQGGHLIRYNLQNN